MPKPTIGDALNRGSRFLHQNGSESPRLDAEVLLAHLLGRDRVYLYRESRQELGDDTAARYRSLLERRAAGEPVAYITGHREFMGLDFLVGPPVLIPRPETELLVERALEALAGWPGRRIAVDVGTGSGAVAVSLARLAPGCRVYATDVSAEALAVARENARRLGARVFFGRGDLLDPLRGVLHPGTVAVMAANLPYIPGSEMLELPRSVRDFEPRQALDGGPDGLAHYCRLVPQAGDFLAPGGTLLMEIGPDQAGQARALVPPPCWDAEVLPDLAGRPRLVVARKSRGSDL